MVHEAIRKQVGDDYIVGIRFVVDEDIEEGIGFEEYVRLAQLFEREGHIDFFNAIFGRMDTDLVLAEHNMPGMSQPLAPFLAKVGPSSARSGCRSSMPRASRHRHGAPCHRREPFGHGGDDARPHGRSADRQQADARRGGAHPALRRRLAPCIRSLPASITGDGARANLPQIVPPSPAGRKVVVVGGGPAGLEAARVAAERGHKVCCSRRPTNWAASSCWRSARPGGATSSPSSTGAPPSWRGWASRSASTPTPARRRVAAKSPMR